MLIRILAIVILCICFCGCSTTKPAPSTKHYLLDANDLPPSRVLSGRLVEVSKIALPDYLDQPNLVIRDSDQRIIIAHYHSWADELNSSIRRLLINRLSEKNQHYNFVKRCDSCRRIRVSVDHFYPTSGGQAILAGEYEVLGRNEVFHRERFTLYKDLEEDGYDHAVACMAKLVDDLADRINSANALLPGG